MGGPSGMSVGSLKLGKEDGTMSSLCEVEVAPSSGLDTGSLVLVENVLGGLWRVGRSSTESVLGNVLDEVLDFFLEEGLLESVTVDETAPVLLGVAPGVLVLVR